MTGRHAAPGRGRLVSDIIRLVVIVLVLFAVIVGGAIAITNWLSSDDDPIALGSTTTTTNQESSSTTSTAASSSTSGATTSTTVADATTTSAATTTTTAPTTTTTTIRPPADVTVLVLNSTSRNGLASRVSDTLEALGYTTVEPTNYDPALDTSRIWYAPGFESEAEVLAEAIPDGIIEPFSGDDAEADIVVVLGASFTE